MVDQEKKADTVDNVEVSPSTPEVEDGPAEAERPADVPEEAVIIEGAPVTVAAAEAEDVPPKKEWSNDSRGWKWARIGVGLVIFLISLFFYLYGNGAHSLWDRDEPRYAAAAQTMFTTGDFIVPKFNGDIRYDKPVLIYWLMTVPMKFFGVNEFSCRMVQGIAASCTVACVWYFAWLLGLSWLSAAAATLAVGFSPLLLMVGKASTTDSVLLLFIVAALMVHWVQMYRGFCICRHLIFWVLVALCALVKGHPGLIIIFLTFWTDHLWTYKATRYDKLVEGPPYSAFPDWRTGLQRMAIGVSVFVLVVAPWVVTAWVRTHGDFFLTQLDKHVLGHAIRTMDSHWGPAVYYVPVLCMALIVVLPALLAAVPAFKRQTDLHSVRFLLSWFIPAFVVFSLAGTKLPHYVLPIIPPLALLVGYSLSCQAQIQTWRPVPRGWLSLWMLFAAALALLLAVLTRKSGWPASTLGIVSLLCLLGSWWLAPVSSLWNFGATILLLLGLLLAPAVPLSLLYLRAGHVLWGMLWGAATGCLVAMTAVVWWRRNIKGALAMSAASMALLWAMVFLFLLPAVEPLRPGKKAGRWLAENVSPQAQLFMAGYKEGSLVFYSNRVLRETGSGPTERDLVFKALKDGKTSTSLVITRDLWDTWTKDVKPPMFVNLIDLGHFYNFNKGKRCDIMIFTN